MLVITAPKAQIVGEALRYIMNTKHVSARALGEHVGLYEANISKMLKMGQGFPKHKKSIFKYLETSQEEFESLVADIEHLLIGLGVSILDIENSSQIAISYIQFQLILKEQL